MAYNSDIPQASDDPSQSQSLLLANFQELNTNNSVNHVALNDPDQGKHKFLQMPEQSSSPATAANEGALYTVESSLTSVSELVFRRESSGTEIEFTSSLDSTNGWTRLPSGILLKWGTSTADGNTATSFPTSATIPVFSTVLSAQVTVEDSSGTPNTMATLAAFSTTQITVFGSQRATLSTASVTYRYLVIGT